MGYEAMGWLLIIVIAVAAVLLLCMFAEIAYDAYKMRRLNERLDAVNKHERRYRHDS